VNASTRAGLLGNVVEPTVAGGDAQGLDRLGVVLELGDDGGPGQVEEVVADERGLGQGALGRRQGGVDVLAGGAQALADLRGRDAER
jgi:hypothetical protein